MLWDSWRLWFSIRPRENNPAALVCSSSPPSHRSPPPSHRSPPPVYDSSRPRRRVLFLLPPTRSLPFFAAAHSNSHPAALVVTALAPFVCRPLPLPVAGQMRRLSTVRFPPRRVPLRHHPPVRLFAVSSCARRLSTNRQRVNAMCDSLVMPFLISLNDIDNRDQNRIYTS